MGRFLKSCIFKGANIPGIYNLTKKLKRGALVLLYHGIESEIIDARVQGLHLPFRMFEKQIQYLRRNFEIISLDYLYDCLANGYKIDSSQILITFDDGYKSTINIVAPYLRSFKIPFSVFISTNHITEGYRFPTYYLRVAIFYSERKNIDISTIRKKIDISTLEGSIYAKNTIESLLKTAPHQVATSIVKDLINSIPNNKWLEINNIFSSDEPMNWSDVKNLHNIGVTVGSHCHDHFILHSNQSKSEMNIQLKTSKDLIEKNLGECKYFAYPNGRKEHISFDSMMSVRKNKYFLGFTVCRGEIENSSNPYFLPRVGASEDLDHFKFIINTSFRYNWQFRKYSLKLDEYSTYI